MVTTTERRDFNRVPFQHDADLYLGSHCWHTDILDLSLKGALVKRPEEWPANIGELCKLILPLDAGGDHIEMHCTLVGTSEGRLHLLVNEMDVTSASRLRRLMELNLGTPELLERNLGKLIDTHH
ncbi:PilZ domain-containing protein [Gallaecimonas kandeliae]|uniref:PilZ domain-containing protein n=1 Tax=Gallaecimonas kandeliae TaxID=3029055 RepID=UPI0026473DC0|nr:PilZ domain-containing protein [Gallaecimonas kandeliae]WKE64923.1 PilZ domain-containing protein [Gallaecimonas kandeliae]